MFFLGFVYLLLMAFLYLDYVLPWLNEKIHEAEIGSRKRRALVLFDQYVIIFMGLIAFAVDLLCYYFRS